MTNKIYLLIAGVVLIAFVWYGHSEYKRGFQDAKDEQNSRIIKMLQEHKEEKEKSLERIKRLQNGIDKNKTWSTKPLPSDIRRLLLS